jgi:hypothetical protein
VTDYGRCPKCGEPGFLKGKFADHRCKPLFWWRSNDRHDEDEWQEIHASDAEEAAQKAAALYDQDGYSLLRGGHAEISIRDTLTGKVTRWHCKAEPVPQYWVVQMDMEE